MRQFWLMGFLLTAHGALAHTPASAARAGMAFVPMNPAIQADRDAMANMMAGMNAPYTGDPDHDFVSHMIPHHQGAIDMARTELKYGHDAKLKQLAARIVAAQTSEIAFMKAWQASHAAPQTKAPDNPHIHYK